MKNMRPGLRAIKTIIIVPMSTASTLLPQHSPTFLNTLNHHTPHRVPYYSMCPSSIFFFPTRGEAFDIASTPFFGQTKNKNSVPCCTQRYLHPIKISSRYITVHFCFFFTLLEERGSAADIIIDIIGEKCRNS